MPPQLALLLTVIFCVAMLRHVGRSDGPSSKALWLPLAWMFFAWSRFPAQWLHMFGFSVYTSGASVEDGSPFDALAFLLMIISGILILKKRKINFSLLARNNLLLTIFFIYCFLSILWSDFPLLSLKRWIKTLGHPIMALILLTTPNPIGAVKRIFFQLAILTLPTSILLIKYFPQFGRGFDNWTGAATNQGIFLSKNELGSVCMITGMYFVWHLLAIRELTTTKARLREFAIGIGFFGMIFWLLTSSQSATSLLCLALGGTTIVALGFRFVSKHNFGFHLIIVLLFAGMLESTVGIYEPTLKLLGRNATLTDRTEVWDDAFKLADSPVIGAGFEGFWLGDRLKKMWEKWWWQPIQAHNGYVETYLNLGFVGVALLILTIIGAFRKITASFMSEFLFARFRMGVLFTIILSNFTEATFRAMSVLWTIFYIIAIDYPTQQENHYNAVTDSDPQLQLNDRGLQSEYYNTP